MPRQFHMHSLRQRLAVEAARRVVEGEPDYWQALAKAIDSSSDNSLRERPTVAEIDAEVAVLQSWSETPKRAAQLRQLRLTAARFMRELEAYSPVLLGPVATGTAVADSPIWIELSLSPFDAKSFEVDLINRHWQFDTLSARSKADSRAAQAYRVVWMREEAFVTLVGTQQEYRNRDWTLRLTAQELHVLNDRPD